MVAFFTGSLGAGFERGSGTAIGAGGVIGGSAFGRGAEGVSINARSGNLLVSRNDEFLVGRGPDASVGRTYNSLYLTPEDNLDQWRLHEDRRIYTVSGPLHQATSSDTTASSVKRISADGSDITYTWSMRNGRLSYWTTDGGGAHDELQYSGNTWTWIQGGSDSRETYQDNGQSGAGQHWRLYQHVDRDGNALTYSYSGDRLHRVTTASNDYVQYGWTGNNLTSLTTQRVVFGGTSVSVVERSTVSYVYDALNRLTGVQVSLTRSDGTGSGNYAFGYEYAGSTKLITKITQSDGSAMEFAYDMSGRVTEVRTLVQGSVTRNTTIVYNVGSTEIIDHRGARTVMSYDANGQLTSVTQPTFTPGAPGAATQFSYDGSGNLISMTDAGGGITQFTYDDRGNVLSSRTPLQAETTMTYDADGRLLARQQISAAPGGPTQTSSINYVYTSTGQLAFEVSSEGRVVSYTYHGPGPLNGLLKSRDTFAGNRFPVVAGQSPSLAALNAWLASGGIAWSQVTREAYQYDARGEVSELIRGTPASQFGALSTITGISTTTFVRDQSGRILRQQTGPEDATFYVYDGLGRVVLSTNPQTGTTAFDFQDAFNQTLVTDANGLWSLSTYNKAGDHLTQVELGSHLPQTLDTFLYDSAGYLRRSRDASGRTKFFLWDAAGRKTAEIIAEGLDGNYLYGSMTEFRYDAAGRLSATTRYFGSVSAQNLQALDNPATSFQPGQIRPAATMYDLWDWTVYDAAGRVAQTILGDGSVTAFQYDDVGRLVTTIGYVDKVSVAAFIAGSGPTAPVVVANPANAAIARSFYDSDGLLIGTLAPDGGLVRYEYDGKGRKVAEYRYAAFTASALRAGGTLAQLQASVVLNPSKDITLHWVYDNQDNLRFEIDGTGRVREYVYFSQQASYSIGRARQVIDHAAVLTTLPSTITAETIAAQLAAAGAASNNRVSWAVYNTKGQLEFTVDSLGQVVRSVFDTGGRLIRSIRFAEALTTPLGANEATWLGQLQTWATPAREAAARTEWKFYNARGDVKYIIDAEGYVTEFGHDAEGRVTYEIRFSNKLYPLNSWQTITLLLADKGASTVKYFGYDGAGRLTLTYDANGNGVSQAFYNNGLKGWDLRAGYQESQSRVMYLYDQAGRLIQELQSAHDLETMNWAGSSTATTLRSPERIVSPSYAYHAGLTSQGELVLYHLGNPIWSNGVRDDQIGSTYRLDTLNTGVIVITRVNASGQDAGIVWQSGSPTAAGGPSFLAVQDDGNLVLYRGTPGFVTAQLWQAQPASMTGQGPGGWLAVSTYTYDGLGNVSKIRNADGHDALFEYDRAGRIIKQTDAEGNETHFEYDAIGQVLKTRDARNAETFTYFDRAGRVIAVRDAEGYYTSTSYNAFGETVSVTRHYIRDTSPTPGAVLQLPVAHAKDTTSTFTYDKLGRVVTAVDAEGSQETSEYNAFGQLVAFINKLAGRTEYAYDKRGLRIEERQIIADPIQTGASETIITRFEYDSRGNMITKIEAADRAEQRRTTFEYDAGNRLIARKGEARLVYANGTASGVTVTPTETYKYDRRNNIIEIVAPDGGRTLRWYNTSDQVTHEISAGGTLTRHFYAPDGQLIETQVFDQRVSEMAGITMPANAWQMPPAGTGPKRVVKYTYDKLNRLLTTTTDPVTVTALSGSGASTTLSATARALTTTYTYDATGNVLSVTDADGYQTISTYDKLGRKVTEVDPERFWTTWTYDAVGNVLSERRFATRGTDTVTLPPIDPVHDRVTEFTYDRLGRRTALTRKNVAVFDSAVTNSTAANDSIKFVDSTIEYVYNALGQVITRREAVQYGGEKDFTTYIYDTAGRLRREFRKAIVTFDGTLSPIMTYSYDGLGNMVSSTQWGMGSVQQRVTTFTYGTGGLLQTSTDAEGFTRTWRHDAAGRVTREEYTRTKSDLSTQLIEGKGTDYDLDGRATTTSAVMFVNGAWTRGVQAGAFGGFANDVTTTVTNAHGDVVERRVNGVVVERNSYDNVGRLFKSNAGDGVWRFYGHDGRGNQTLMIASIGADLSQLDLNGAMNLWGSDRDAIRTGLVNGQPLTGVTATLTRYDGRSQGVEVLEPQRQFSNGQQFSTAVWGPERASLVTQRSYNAFGELAFEINTRQQGITAESRIDYHYNTMGRLIRIESPWVALKGASAADQRNWGVTAAASGNLSGTTTGPDTEGLTWFERPTERRYYDESGRLVATRDANGNRTTMTLLGGTGYAGSEALVTTITHPDGTQEVRTFDVHGDLRQVDNRGRVSTMTYDRMGRLTTSTQAGFVENIRYDGLGQMIRKWSTITLDDAHQERFDYDQQGRLVYQRAAGGDVTRYDHQFFQWLQNEGMGQFGGWEKKTTLANNLTTFEYTDSHGRVTKSTDMSWRNTVSVYDRGGRQIRREDEGGPAGSFAMHFTWYNTGQLAGQYVLQPQQAGGQTAEIRYDTFYRYDAAGNLTGQKSTRTGTFLVPTGQYGYGGAPIYAAQTVNEMRSDQAAAYDALGRMIYWQENGGLVPTASMAWRYDAVGNVRQDFGSSFSLNQSGWASTATNHNHWYRYDSLNRIVTDKGMLQGGQVVRGSGGTDIFYNNTGPLGSGANGGSGGDRAFIIVSDTVFVNEPVQRTRWDPRIMEWITETVMQPVPYATIRRESYEYDAAGRLLNVRSLLGDKHGNLPTGQAGSLIGAYTYDLAGRVVTEHNYHDTDSVNAVYSRTITYDMPTGRIASESSTSNQRTISIDNTPTTLVVTTSSTTYNYGSVATHSTSYALGQLMGLTVSSTRTEGSAAPVTTVDQTNYSFNFGMAPRQTSVSHSKGVNGGAITATGTTTLNYLRVGGEDILSTANIADGRARTVTYLSDMSGQTVVRRETPSGAGGGAPVEMWYRFGGRELGKVTNDGTMMATFKSSVIERGAASHLNGQIGPFQGGGQMGLARNEFGSRIQQVTAYNQGSGAGNYTARGGETLQAIAQSLWGDSGLWYKIAQANGLTGQESLAPGQTIRLPAGVMRNTYNANTITPADPGDTLGDITPSTPQAQPPARRKCGGVGQFFLTVFSFAVQTVLNAFFPGAGTFVGKIVTSAIANAVTQTVAIAAGIQEKFSWNQVGMAALSSAVSSGLEQVSGLNNATTVSGKMAQAAGRAAIGSIATQGIGIALGWQKKFDFAGVAAAGVGAAAGTWAGSRLPGATSGRNGGPTLAHEAGVVTVSTLAMAATRTLIDGSDFGDNVLASLPDALGTVVGKRLGRVVVGSLDGSRNNAATLEKDPVAALGKKTPAAPKVLAMPDITTSTSVGGASGLMGAAGLEKMGSDSNDQDTQANGIKGPNDRAANGTPIPSIETSTSRQEIRSTRQPAGQIPVGVLKPNYRPLYMTQLEGSDRTWLAVRDDSGKRRYIAVTVLLPSARAEIASDRPRSAQAAVQLSALIRAAEDDIKIQTLAEGRPIPVTLPGSSATSGTSAASASGGAVRPAPTVAARSEAAPDQPVAPSEPSGALAEDLTVAGVEATFGSLEVWMSHHANLDASSRRALSSAMGSLGGFPGYAMDLGGEAAEFRRRMAVPDAHLNGELRASAGRLTVSVGGGIAAGAVAGVIAGRIATAGLVAAGPAGWIGFGLGIGAGILWSAADRRFGLSEQFGAALRDFQLKPHPRSLEQLRDWLRRHQPDAFSDQENLRGY